MLYFVGIMERRFIYEYMRNWFHSPLVVAVLHYPPWLRHCSVRCYTYHRFVFYVMASVVVLVIDRANSGEGGGRPVRPRARYVAHCPAVAPPRGVGARSSGRLADVQCVVLVGRSVTPRSLVEFGRILSL